MHSPCLLCRSLKPMRKGWRCFGTSCCKCALLAGNSESRAHDHHQVALPLPRYAHDQSSPTSDWNSTPQADLFLFVPTFLSWIQVGLKLVPVEKRSSTVSMSQSTDVCWCTYSLPAYLHISRESTPPSTGDSLACARHDRQLQNSMM